MTSIEHLFARAAELVSRSVANVKEDQLTNATPCTDWDLRALLNHVYGEAAWISAMLKGETIEQIGDRYSGDLVGQRVEQSWAEIASDATATVKATPGDATVVLSRGPSTAESYAREVAADLTVHSWDIARALGVDDTLDPELIALANDTFGPMVEEGRKYGIFGPPPELAPDADEQTKMLALFGRSTEWKP